MTAIGLGEQFGPWLGQENTALPTIALISVWQFVGIPLMLIYAALIAIPEEVVEAAAVEGASPWRIFWSIRLPLILPTLGLVNILTFVGNFNAFDLIYAVKGALAGPNFATDLLGTLFYRTFFGYQSRDGQRHDGRGAGHADVPRDPGGRRPVLLRRPAAPAALRVMSAGPRASRAGALGRSALVHLTLGGYCLLVLCPILLVLLNSFKTRGRASSTTRWACRRRPR